MFGFFKNGQSGRIVPDEVGLVQNLLELEAAGRYITGMDHLEFKGKTAVITGGGRGIGLCIAKTFLEAGASAVLAEVEAQLEPKALAFLNSPDALFVQTDVSEEASVQRMVRRALERFGRIDCLVNNAAVARNVPVSELSYEDWRRVIDTDLSGAFLCAKHCAAALKEARGSIVNIASTRALMSEPNTEAYSAAKGGLVALTHALAVSLGPAVRVNCISPGWIDTTAYLHGAPSPWVIRSEDHAQHPAGRVGRPEDVARMVLYLCSRRAEFITGQNFVLDGGMTKKMIYLE
ncbi:MAG TPA: SDR family oxidoreductase [Anaerohalosphaeraceae bacterium]|nr:SDR family oxidoreductase [Anaerohalosphaeraceae bacterium]HPP55649.1 SDR family oxidoreductase [Anaerohalosphaeraceae bacterium]